MKTLPIDLQRERLFEEGLIARYESCPVCSSSNRDRAPRKASTDRYMLALGKELGLSIPELLELLSVHECKQCSTVYCDPWLSLKGMTRLYTNGHPQHLLGWRTFYDWVQETPYSSKTLDRQALWNLLGEVAGETAVYGELSCPFMGLLFFFEDRELNGHDKVEHVAKGMHHLQRNLLHPWNPRGFRNQVVRRYRKLRKKLLKERVADAQIDYGNANSASARLIKTRLRYRDYRDRTPTSDREAAPNGHKVPEKRYLVFEPSPCFWGTNCVSMNCTCRAVCSGVLNTPVIDFKDVERENIRFDVFGIFNSLDHFVDPRAMIKRALAVSRLVYIDVHMSGSRDTFNRQHLYAFGRNFLEAIREKDWSYLDITEFARRPGQNCYIVSREIDLAGLKGLGPAGRLG